MRRKPITPERLASKVDSIMAIRDNETAHGDEDDLRLRVIVDYCPDWVVREIRRLRDAPFTRWYA